MRPFGKIRQFLHRLRRSVPSESEPLPPQISGEELRQFLPTFLSQGSQTAFLEEIRHFLGTQVKPFYTSALAREPVLFQGDGLDGLLIINLPDATIKPGKALLVSNTCDVDPSNRRMFSVSLTYAPILSLPRYLSALRQQFPEERVTQHESDIRQQLITQIFFLPKGGTLEGDCFVLLDRMISCASTAVDREKIPDIRLFTLSDFGAWLLALKLSIHFCRIRDQVDRNAGRIG